MMIKVLAVAAVVATSLVAVSGTVEAGHAKSSAEFQGMLDNIHARQVEQRAALYGKTTPKLSPAAFQEMINKIQESQARQRAEVYGN